LRDFLAAFFQSDDWIFLF
jgi:hypothetical protein